MADGIMHKPSHEDWLKWSQVVIDRLTCAVHIYKKSPYEDVFMADQERQDKNTRIIALLHGIHKLIDDAETPTESLAEVAYHDERVISGLKVLMADTLALLPQISDDMQKLLKSHWHSKCTGRLADELFRGPLGNEPEGIGSGHAEHGRLPEVLKNMLEQEQMGDIRRPREALVRHEGGPSRGNDETQRRWADKNSQYLRTAGRME
ncbi:MAG: hypothetical protein WAO98_00585 [Alphaproteobacteria bacterium]